MGITLHQLLKLKSNPQKSYGLGYPLLAAKAQTKKAERCSLPDYGKDAYLSEVIASTWQGGV